MSDTPEEMEGEGSGIDYKGASVRVGCGGRVGNLLEASTTVTGQPSGFLPSGVNVDEERHKR